MRISIFKDGHFSPVVSKTIKTINDVEHNHRELGQRLLEKYVDAELASAIIGEYTAVIVYSDLSCSLHRFRVEEIPQPKLRVVSI